MVVVLQFRDASFPAVCTTKRLFLRMSGRDLFLSFNIPGIRTVASPSTLIQHKSLYMDRYHDCKSRLAAPLDLGKVGYHPGMPFAALSDCK